MVGEQTVDPAKLMPRLRQERLRQNLTLEWVADRVKVSHASISEFESGRKQPKEDTLRRWLKALDMPDEWADLWVEFQIGEKVRELLETRRGPRAVDPADIEAAVRYVRRLFGR